MKSVIFVSYGKGMYALNKLLQNALLRSIRLANHLWNIVRLSWFASLAGEKENVRKGYEIQRPFGKNGLLWYTLFCRETDKASKCYESMKFTTTSQARSSTSIYRGKGRPAYNGVLRTLQRQFNCRQIQNFCNRKLKKPRDGMSHWRISQI